jgi:hypothetical protein
MGEAWAEGFGSSAKSFKFARDDSNIRPLLRRHWTGSLKRGLSRNDGYAGRDTDPEAHAVRPQLDHGP